MLQIIRFEPVIQVFHPSGTSGFLDLISHKGHNIYSVIKMFRLDSLLGLGTAICDVLCKTGSGPR
jgi:hypothetical protein